MAGWTKISVWLFIGAVMVVDVAFAIRHRDTMVDWESNPAMRCCCVKCGVVSAVVVRLVTVLFGAGVAFFGRYLPRLGLWRVCRERYERALRRAELAMTAVPLVVHVYLGGVYVCILAM